jgi:2-polyprenyl-3-methyl-5-hydroxy-6-metoxy-1,4-benzoquinol methylase
MDSREETTRLYDKWAEKNFIDWFNNEALLPTLGEFISLLPQYPTVLDLGCGTGGESKRVSNLGADVIGIDLSKESIKYAQENVKNARFYVMNILDMKFEEQQFDGVFEAGVLFHFNETEQRNILEDLHRYIKGNGLFLSYYPEGNFEGMDEFDIEGIKYRRYARRIPKQVWINTVELFGFELLKEMEFNLGRFRALLFKKI